MNNDQNLGRKGEIEEEGEQIRVVVNFKELMAMGISALLVYRQLSGQVKSTVKEELARLNELIPAMEILIQLASPTVMSLLKLQNQKSVPLDDHTSETSINQGEEEIKTKDQKDLEDFLQHTTEEKLKQETADLKKLKNFYDKIRKQITELSKPDTSNDLYTRSLTIIINKYKLISLLTLQASILSDFKKFRDIFIHSIRISYKEYLNQFKYPDVFHSHHWSVKFLVKMANYFRKKEETPLLKKEFCYFMYIVTQYMQKLTPNSSLYQIITEKMTKNLGITDFLRLCQEMEDLRDLFSSTSDLKDVKNLLVKINNPINWRYITNSLFGINITVAFGDAEWTKEWIAEYSLTPAQKKAKQEKEKQDKENEQKESSQVLKEEGVENKGAENKSKVLTIMNQWPSDIYIIDPTGIAPLQLFIDQTYTFNGIFENPTQTIQIQGIDSILKILSSQNEINLENLQSMKDSKFYYLHEILFFMIDLEVKPNLLESARKDRHTFLNKLIKIGSDLLSKTTVQSAIDYLFEMEGAKPWINYIQQINYDELPSTPNANAEQELSRLIKRREGIEKLLKPQLSGDQLIEFLYFVISSTRKIDFDWQDIRDWDFRINNIKRLTPIKGISKEYLEQEKENIDKEINLYDLLIDRTNAVLKNISSKTKDGLQSEVAWLIVELKYGFSGLLELHKKIEADYINFGVLFIDCIERVCQNYLINFPNPSASHSHQWSVQLLQSLVASFKHTSEGNTKSIGVKKSKLEFVFLMSIFLKYLNKLGQDSLLKHELANNLFKEMGIYDLIRAQQELKILFERIEKITIKDPEIETIIKEILLNFNKSNLIDSKNILNTLLTFDEKVTYSLNNLEEEKIDNINLKKRICTLSMSEKMNFSLTEDKKINALFDKGDIKIKGLGPLKQHFYQTSEGTYSEPIERLLETYNLYFVQEFLLKIIELETINNFWPTATQNRHDALGVLLKLAKEFLEKNNVQECSEAIDPSRIAIVQRGFQDADQFFKGINKAVGIGIDKKKEEVIIHPK